MKNIKLFINGMHCVNCANSIKQAALKQGALTANVDFINKFGEFSVNDDFDSEKLIFAIKKLGFEVSLDKIKAKNTYEGTRLVFLAIFSVLTFIDFGFFISCLIASFAILLSYDFYKRVIFHKSYGMDLLVVLGISINYFYSFFSVHHHFFFESTFVCFVIRLGKFIENKAKAKANSLIAPSEIPNITLVSGETKKANEISINDELIIKNGEEILVDGICLNDALINESVISGESVSLVKKAGDFIYAGSINDGEVLKMRASCEYYESSLEKLKDEAMKASNKELKAFKMVDKISRYFVLIICIIASITGIAWYFIDSSKVFFYVSSVLLISCPCALGLAIPMVIAICINLCFKEKIILKNPELISSIKDIECFIFDKTGTLTNDIQAIKHDLSYDDFRLIASIENLQNHPIAKSITNNFNDFLALNGKSYLQDNVLHYEDESVKVRIEPLENDLMCYKNDGFIGKITLENELNKNAKELIEFLKSLGKRIIIISGDSKNKVVDLAKKLNIDEYYYRVSPVQKAEIISQLGVSSVFVGDGANDIKALRKANFGISFSKANAIAKNKADALLLENDLIKIKKLFEIFDQSYSKIKQNLFISFFYNFFGIALACGIFSEINLHLNPALCAMLMSISSLIVVFNSLLLFKELKS